MSIAIWQSGGKYEQLLQKVERVKRRQRLHSKRNCNFTGYATNTVFKIRTRKKRHPNGYLKETLLNVQSLSRLYTRTSKRSELAKIKREPKPHKHFDSLYTTYRKEGIYAEYLSSSRCHYGCSGTHRFTDHHHKKDIQHLTQSMQ